MNQLTKRIINKCLKRNLSISTAESCTGGLLSFAFTSISGASKVYTCGFTTYSNKSKNRILNISNKLLNKHGAVSEEICVSMAQNLNKISKTSLAISITGIAGPNGGTKLKPVGLVYSAIKFKNKIICKKFLIKKRGRSYIQKESVRKTLVLLDSLI